MSFVREIWTLSTFSPPRLLSMMMMFRSGILRVWLGSTKNDRFGQHGTSLCTVSSNHLNRKGNFWNLATLKAHTMFLGCTYSYRIYISNTVLIYYSGRYFLGADHHFIKYQAGKQRTTTRTCRPHPNATSFVADLISLSHRICVKMIRCPLSFFSWIVCF